MAQKRYINTKFWSDNFIVGLNPLERYLYLYFLTNEHTNICGIYELPLRTMAFETGLDAEMLEKMFTRFDKKIHYISGWVYIKNFAKNQSINDSVRLGIDRAMKDIPEEIMLKIDVLNQPVPDCTPPAGYLTKPNLTKPNLRETQSVAPREVSQRFFSEGSEQEAIISLLTQKGIPEDIVRREIEKFVSYWTELNQSGTKQRWQQEKTFEIKRRLATWFSRVNTFNGVEKQRNKIAFI